MKPTIQRDVYAAEEVGAEDYATERGWDPQQELRESAAAAVGFVE